MHVGPRHVTIGAEQRDATLLRAVAELLDTAGRLLGRNDLAACARAHAPLATTRPVVRRVALGGAGADPTLAARVIHAQLRGRGGGR